jgi:hypothetical protein
MPHSLELNTRVTGSNRPRRPKKNRRHPNGRGNDGPMESQHRFPQSLENACAFHTFPPPRLRLPSLQQKGKLVVPEREQYLILITLDRLPARVPAHYRWGRQRRGRHPRSSSG